MPAFVRETKKNLGQFEQKNGYTPRLFMECGRFVTGPHGVLVATVTNRMSKYREYVGVDAATMSANPRPAIYGAYHHITILDPSGKPKHGREEIVDIVGPLCENSDKFAKQRLLPETIEGISWCSTIPAHTPRQWGGITTAGCGPAVIAPHRRHGRINPARRDHRRPFRHTEF